MCRRCISKNSESQASVKFVSNPSKSESECVVSKNSESQTSPKLVTDARESESETVVSKENENHARTVKVKRVFC